MTKKLLAILAAAACMLSAMSTQVLADEDRINDGYITAIHATPVIDAELDDIWGKTEVQPIDNWLPGFSEYETDTTGTLRVMWDESYMYVFVEVDKHGQDVFPGDASWSSLSNTDNVLVVTSQGLYEEFEDVTTLLTDDAGCFRVTAGNLTNGLGLWYQRTAEIYHAAAKITSASTYQCEFAIPWDSETFKPGVNQKVGLEIQLNVNTVGDDKRYSVVEWSEPEECLAWNSTAYMSVCELIGEPAPDPVIDPTPAVTPDAPPTFDPQVLFGALTAVSAAGILLTRKRKH